MKCDIPEQSINCCSDKETNFLALIACWASKDPVAENDQQDPQLP